jgi:AraC family transcriptional regulator
VGFVLSEPLPPSERVLYGSDIVVIGQVRCPPDVPHFRDCGSTRTYCAIFPRSAVLIRRGDRRPFVEDPTVVGLYNRGEDYERFKVSPEGDRGDWFGFAPAAIRDIVRLVDPAAADSVRPLKVGWARVSARTFLQQRQIFEHVRRTATPDPLLVDERCLQLLATIVSEAYGGVQELSSDDRSYELVEAIRTTIDKRFAGSLSLVAIANDVGTSPFHLCRAFRRVFGTSIHRYLTSVRLRRAVECLGREGVDLGELAIQLGFNSHSHFSAAFRREFQTTPSTCRGRFAGGQLGDQRSRAWNS